MVTAERTFVDTDILIDVARRLPRAVIINGEVVMEHRQHLRFNKEDVLAQLREAAAQPPTAQDRERAELYRQCRPVCVEFLNQYLDQE